MWHDYFTVEQGSANCCCKGQMVNILIFEGHEVYCSYLTLPLKDKSSHRQAICK